jgi:hypothetical protein
MFHRFFKYRRLNNYQIKGVLKLQVQAKLMLLVADPRNIGRLCEVLGSMPNIEFPTMGGPLFWDDLASYNGWKLQQNKITCHCRVLDSEDIRRAWGSEQAMMKALNQLMPVEEERPIPNTSAIDEIKKLAELFKEGFLSKEEFERLKQQIV